MELLHISIENVLFHVSELFTYLNKVILLLGQRGSDNRGRTVPCTVVQYFASWANAKKTPDKQHCSKPT